MKSGVEFPACGIESMFKSFLIWEFSISDVQYVITQKTSRQWAADQSWFPDRTMRHCPRGGYLVQQWHRRRLAEQEGVRLVLLLPAREESHVIFICNLKLEIEG